MQEEAPKVPVKKVKGRIKLLQTMPYKGCQIYIRQVDSDIFMYDVIFNNQLYSDYVIITPDKGKKKLTDKQILSSGGLVFAAACTTIDELLKLVQKSLLSNPVSSDRVKKRRVN